MRKSLESKPVDAKVDLSKGFIDEHGSKTGLRVKYNTLAKEVEQTLLDPGNTDDGEDQDDRRAAQGLDRGAGQEVPGGADRGPRLASS